MTTKYLIATVATDVKPSGEYSHGTILPSGEVRDYLDGILNSHGRITRDLINGQMVQEAETATWQLSRWRGEPMRLCGYLTRIDVYPAPDDWNHADEQAWRQLADDYDDRGRRRKARDNEKRIRDRIDRNLHVPEDDPDYPAVLAYLTEAEHWTALDYAVKELKRFRAMADRPEVVGAMHPAYRKWQWAVGSAELARRNGETAKQYETALIAEIT